MWGKIRRKIRGKLPQCKSCPYLQYDLSVGAFLTYKNTCNSHKAKKKIMSVSSDMSKNIRVGRSEKSFFFFFNFF